MKTKVPKYRTIQVKQFEQTNKEDVVQWRDEYQRCEREALIEKLSAMSQQYVEVGRSHECSHVRVYDWEEVDVERIETPSQWASRIRARFAKEAPPEDLRKYLLMDYHEGVQYLRSYFPDELEDSE